MVQTRRTAGRHKYSVLLPTYNERDNIAIIVWLIIRSFEQWQAPLVPHTIPARHLLAARSTPPHTLTSQCRMLHTKLHHLASGCQQTAHEGLGAGLHAHAARPTHCFVP